MAGQAGALHGTRHHTEAQFREMLYLNTEEISCQTSASGSDFTAHILHQVLLNSPDHQPDGCLILQASLWRAEATHQGWLGGCIPPDPTKMASRMREKEQSTQRCAQLGSGARLKDNVHTIDSEAGSTVALLLHPFRPLVTSVDGGGTVRVHNYRHSTVINRFHVTGMVTLLVCGLFSF